MNPLFMFLLLSFGKGDYMGTYQGEPFLAPGSLAEDFAIAFKAIECPWAEKDLPANRIDYPKVCQKPFSGKEEHNLPDHGIRLHMPGYHKDRRAFIHGISGEMVFNCIIFHSSICVSVICTGWKMMPWNRASGFRHPMHAAAAHVWSATGFVWPYTWNNLPKEIEYV
jgi:hypothetical protein